MERQAKPLNRIQFESLALQLKPKIDRAIAGAESNLSERNNVSALWVLLQGQEALRYIYFLGGVALGSGQLSTAKSRQVLEDLGISLGQEGPTAKVPDMGYDSALHYLGEEDSDA